MLTGRVFADRMLAVCLFVIDLAGLSIPILRFAHAFVATYQTERNNRYAQQQHKYLFAPSLAASLAAVYLPVHQENPPC